MKKKLETKKSPKRNQVWIEEDQFRKLKILAAKEGTTLFQLTQKIVEKGLSK
jgi:hypothetical protein